MGNHWHFPCAILPSLIHCHLKVETLNTLNLEMQHLAQLLTDHIRTVGSTRELLSPAGSVPSCTELIPPFPLTCCAFGS